MVHQHTTFKSKIICKLHLKSCVQLVNNEGVVHHLSMMNMRYTYPNTHLLPFLLVVNHIMLDINCFYNNASSMTLEQQLQFPCRGVIR